MKKSRGRKRDKLSRRRKPSSKKHKRKMTKRRKKSQTRQSRKKLGGAWRPVAAAVAAGAGAAIALAARRAHTSSSTALPQAPEGLTIRDPGQNHGSADSDVIVINNSVSICLKILERMKVAELCGLLNVGGSRNLYVGLAGPTMLMLLRYLLSKGRIEENTIIIMTGSLERDEIDFYQGMGFERDISYGINDIRGKYKCKVSTFLSTLEETFPG